MIRDIEHAQSVQRSREAAGKRGAAGAVKRWNRRQSPGGGQRLSYRPGKPSKRAAGGVG